jgi:uncharacterized membrane protein YGL010W
MRNVDLLFEQYGETHRNPVNKAIHWVCVPLITWSVLAVLWVASPVAACVFIALTLVYYVRMSMPIAVGMLLMSSLMIAVLPLLGANTLWAAIAVFVAAWIGQFVGHAIEGRKPKFLQDLQFLLVGPAWLLGALYRGIGIRY